MSDNSETLRHESRALGSDEDAADPAYTVLWAAERLEECEAQLTAKDAEIERLQAKLDELDADYAEACVPDEKDV